MRYMFATKIYEGQLSEPVPLFSDEIHKTVTVYTVHSLARSLKMISMLRAQNCGLLLLCRIRIGSNIR